MQTCWLFDTLAVAVERIDFLDPAVATEANARERGARIELRPLRTTHRGSVYASDEAVLLPAVCRIDLLESAPDAADRMHWHPTMSDGEPGDRVFDRAIPADPVGWLSARLDAVLDLLAQSGVSEVEAHAESATQIAAHKEQILDAARAALAWARQPWPDAAHDERGMAATG